MVESDVCLPLKYREGDVIARIAAGVLVILVIVVAAMWLAHRLSPCPLHWMDKPLARRPVRALVPQPGRSAPLRLFWSPSFDGGSTGIMVPV